MNIRCLCNFLNRFAFSEKTENQLLLVWVQFAGTSKTNTSFHGSLPTGCCAFPDEISLKFGNAAIAYGLISVDSVVELLQQRPPHVHVVLTGRDADPRILELADLATEMVEIKHPYRSGKIARKGIEY